MITGQAGAPMGADIRGRITVHGPNHAGEYRWKITTDHHSTAEHLAADLRPALTATGHHCEIVCPGPLQGMLAAVGPHTGLTVSFAADPATGFALTMPSWQTTHLCTPAVWAFLRNQPDTPVPGELTVRPVDITTRSGRHVRYGLPTLSLQATDRTP